MRKAELFFIAFLLIVGLFSNGSLAQGYTQWNLPEGATTRLGKGKINDITFSPDGAWFAVAATIGIWIYDAQTGEELALLTGHQREVKAVEFSLDRHTFTSVDAGGETRLWDTTTRKLRAIFTESTDLVEEVALSSNGTKLVTANMDDKFRLWHLGETDQEPIIIDDTRQRVLALALSPNGKILAHARTLPMTVNTTVYLYSTETGETLRTLKAFTDQITNLAFSPDGKTIAGGNREAIHLWDTSTGRQLRVCTLERLAVSVTLVFSPDSSILISAARGTVVEFPDGAVRLAGGGWLSEATSVHGGGSIQLWEAHTGALLSTYTGHTDRVQTLTFSKDEKTLASGSADGTILLWDWETLKKANNR